MHVSSTRYRVAQAQDPATLMTNPSSTANNGSQRSFSDALECTALPSQPYSEAIAAPRTGAVGEQLETLLATLIDRERDVDAMLHRAVNGESFGRRDLLRLQALVYSYSESVDIATKVVDRSIGGLRQLLTMQL